MFHQLYPKLIFVLSCFLFSACSARNSSPVFYPNEHLRQVSYTQSQKDIEECRLLADQYAADSEQLKQAARDVAEGAVIGSASGALAGVITNSGVGRATGAGAAVGAIVPLLQLAFKANDPSPTYQRFLEICLSDRGYQIISWK